MPTNGGGKMQMEVPSCVRDVPLGKPKDICVDAADLHKPDIKLTEGHITNRKLPTDMTENTDCRHQATRNNSNNLNVDRPDEPLYMECYKGDNNNKSTSVLDHDIRVGRKKALSKNNSDNIGVFKVFLPTSNGADATEKGHEVLPKRPSASDMNYLQRQDVVDPGVSLNRTAAVCQGETDVYSPHDESPQDPDPCIEIVDQEIGVLCQGKAKDSLIDQIHDCSSVSSDDGIVTPEKPNRSNQQESSFLASPSLYKDRWKLQGARPKTGKVRNRRRLSR